MKISFILNIILISAIASSCETISNIPWSSTPLNQKDEYYFRYSLWKVDGGNRIDTASMRNFSRILREFSEVSFYYDSLEYDVYRFIIDRPFEEPYLLRVVKFDDRRILLYYQEIRKGFRGDLDFVTDEIVVGLPVDFWDELNKTMNTLQFWNNRKADPEYLAGSGIGPVFLEGWVNGKHQALPDYYIDAEHIHLLKDMMQYLTDQTTIYRPF